jgi:Flp pilus assembly protein TadD
LAIGRRNHQPGDPHQAEQAFLQAPRADPVDAEALSHRGAASVATCYRQALRLVPDDPEAQNNLGIVLARQGRLDEAGARFQQALRLKDDYPDAHNNLGNVLEKQDKLDEAMACYQQALRLKPHYPEAHYNLGIVLARQGRLDEAEACYQQALRLKPDYPEAHNNLGTVLTRQDKLDEAEACYQQALRLKPDDPEAHNNLGLVLARQDKLDEAVACYRQALLIKLNYPEAHSNLGNALQEQGRLEEAVACYQQALRLKPDCPEVHSSLGLVLARQDKLEEAVASLQQALRLKPDDPDAHNNLGHVLEKQDKLDEAMARFQQALLLKPDAPEVHNNIGIVLAKQGRLDEAVACYQEALRHQPDYPGAHWNRSLVWLQMGHFEQGWPGYEWRWKCKEFASLPPLDRPQWDGSPLDGRTILVHAEQGLGDTLQFIRYAPLVQQRGGRVILVCQPPLIRLLARSPGIERLVAQGEPLPEYQVHAPLMSLPGLLGTTLESVPADVPYLDAEPRLVEDWRHRLGSYPGFKVGIVWQGNRKFRSDRRRSVPLVQFAPLARVPGVHLLSLQKGAGCEQLPALQGRFPVIDLGSQLDETTGPFMDTAAVMKNLDLVVTSDTATAHLAGALGVPVWVALHDIPDWRWLLHREDSPWYPTMRLFRQTRPGQWEDVFHRIAGELQRRVAAPAELPPITVEIAPGELIDKITILEIKSERITDATKRHHVGTELATLLAARDRAVPGSAELARSATELKAVNEALWQIEDEIRLCERDKDFGPRFVALARSVYRTNDRRAALKRQINERFGSRLAEAKSYTSYEEGIV